MLDTLLPMALLIVVGALWRPLRPMGLDADATRLSITGLVYMLLLPALGVFKGVETTLETLFNLAYLALVRGYLVVQEPDEPLNVSGAITFNGQLFLDPPTISQQFTDFLPDGIVPTRGDEAAVGTRIFQPF